MYAYVQAAGLRCLLCACRDVYALSSFLGRVAGECFPILSSDMLCFPFQVRVRVIVSGSLLNCSSEARPSHMLQHPSASAASCQCVGQEKASCVHQRLECDGFSRLGDSTLQKQPFQSVPCTTLSISGSPQVTALGQVG